MTPPRILLILSPIACILLPRPPSQNQSFPHLGEPITLVPQTIVAWELFLSRIFPITLGKLGTQALQRSCNVQIQDLTLTMGEEDIGYISFAVFKEYAFLQSSFFHLYILNWMS